MNQAAMFDLDEGRERRDRGHKQVAKASIWDPVKRQIDTAIRARARSGAAFTSDDIHELVGDIARPNLIGAAFTAAVRAGIIERCGYDVQSTRPEARARRIPVWRGVAACIHISENDVSDLLERLHGYGEPEQDQLECNKRRPGHSCHEYILLLGRLCDAVGIPRWWDDPCDAQGNRLDEEAWA